MQYSQQGPSKLTLEQLKAARLFTLYKRLNELQSKVKLHFNVCIMKNLKELRDDAYQEVERLQQEDKNFKTIREQLILQCLLLSNLTSQTSLKIKNSEDILQAIIEQDWEISELFLTSKESLKKELSRFHLSNTFLDQLPHKFNIELGRARIKVYAFQIEQYLTKEKVLLEDWWEKLNDIFINLERQLKKCLDLQDWRLVSVCLEPLEILLRQIGSIEDHSKLWIECAKHIRDTRKLFLEAPLPCKQKGDPQKMRKKFVDYRTPIFPELEVGNRSPSS